MDTDTAQSLPETVKRGPGRPPKAAVEAAPEKPDTLTVRILYDTWIGEERVSCIANVGENGEVEYAVIELPYDRAVKLLKDKKAERADLY